MKILITGGSSDIARAIARRRLALGDEILVTASTERSLAQTLKSYSEGGLAARGFVLDFANPEASETTLAAEQSFGAGIGAVVFNAFGRVPSIKPFHEIDFPVARAYLRENVEGNAWLAHRILGPMAERGFGRLVLVSSVSAMLGTANYGIYCAAKAALEGLFLNLAADYGGRGVLSNIARLGMFKTSRTRLFWRRAEYLKKIAEIIPQRVLGEPDQAAEALDPFLSRTSYCNGSILNVSGGLPLVSLGSPHSPSTAAPTAPSSDP